MPEAGLKQILEKLHAEKEVVSGNLVIGIEQEQWCDRHNFAELYRRAIALRRQASAPASREQLYRFQMRWHKINQPGQSLTDLIERYSGFRFPLSTFERDILRNRLCVDNIQILPEKVQQLNGLIKKGDFIVRAHRDSEDSRIKVDFIERGSGNLFINKTELNEAAKGQDESAGAVFSFLKENGASFLRDILGGTGLSALQAQQALSALAKSGLVSCEDYTIFLAILQSDPVNLRQDRSDSWLPQPLPGWTQSSRRSHRRQAIRQSVREQVQFGDSRWFLTTSFGVLGKDVTDTERAERQARLLLQRYGILVKEWYRRENGLLPWYDIFQVLKRLEWQGEIRRGYFIAGLSGVQFALPAAVEVLEEIQTKNEESMSKPILMSTVDPALPLGGTVDWDMQDMHGNKMTIVRSPANHFVFLQDKPVLYSEIYGSRIWRLAKIPKEALDECINVFKSWLQLPADIRPRRRIDVLHINNQPAAECKLAEAFLRNGFEKDGEKLVLWPSGV